MSESQSIPPTVYVALIGGLGGNQFYQAPSLADRLKEIPGVMLDRFNDPLYMVGGRNNIGRKITYCKEIWPEIQRFILIPHSMGWGDAVDACHQGCVDYLIAIDPVGVWKDRDFWPRKDGARQPGCFIKSTKEPRDPLIAQLYVEDGPEIDGYNLGHNELTHDDGIQREIVERVRGFLPPLPVVTS